MIIIGGVVPPQDYEALYEAGAEAIFPGHRISDAAEELITSSMPGSATARRRSSSALSPVTLAIVKQGMTLPKKAPLDIKTLGKRPPPGAARAGRARSR